MIDFKRKITLELEEEPYGVRWVKPTIYANYNVLIGPFSSIPDILKYEKLQKVVQNNGVYFFMAEQDSGPLKVYIGKAENIGDRLRTHLANYRAGKLDEEWQNVCIVSVESDFEEGLLEGELISLAGKCGRAKLTNRQEPKIRSDVEVEGIVKDLQLKLPVLGIHFLHEVKSLGAVFQCVIPKTRHRAKMTPRADERGDVFVVLKNSSLRKPASGAKTSHRYEQLVKNGEVKEGEGGMGTFLKDVGFSSLSTAASIVLGRPANGWKEWRDGETNRTYAECVEKTVGDVSSTPDRKKPAPKFSTRVTASQPRIRAAREAVFALTQRRANQVARAMVRDGSFIVLKGSGTRVSWRGADERSGHSYREKYKELLRSGKIRKDSDEFGVFLEDVAFGSPSTAATFIVGRNTNGTMVWKLEDDPKVTYKDWKDQ